MPGSFLYFEQPVEGTWAANQTECYVLSLTMSIHFTLNLTYHCYTDQTSEPKPSTTTSNVSSITVMTNYSLPVTTRQSYLEKVPVLAHKLRNPVSNPTLIHTISYMNSTASLHWHLPNLCISFDFKAHWKYIWLVKWHCREGTSKTNLIYIKSILQENPRKID